MNKKIKSVLEILRHQFEIFYGNRLAHMVLFGSRARGDAESDSDIDVLVVLHESVDAVEEIRRTSGIVSNLCLEYEVVISCVFMDLYRYENKQGPLLRNIRKEGVAL